MPYRNNYRKKPVLTNKALTKKVRQMENQPELKYKDTDYTISQTQANNFFVEPIGLVGEGVDNRARIGDWIRNTSLKMRMLYRFTPNTATGTVCFFRTIIFYNRETNGTVPPIIGTNDQALLENNSGDYPLLQQYNVTMFESGQYAILYDKVMSITSTNTYLNDESDVVAVPISRFVKKTIKLTRKQGYLGPDAEVSDIFYNGLCIAFYAYIPGSQEADADQVAIEGSIRLYYKDQ